MVTRDPSPRIISFTVLVTERLTCRMGGGSKRAVDQAAGFSMLQIALLNY